MNRARASCDGITPRDRLFQHGGEPHRCLVLEDSPVGVEAGLAAGMRVVAVTITHAPGELPGAHAYVRDVAEWLRLKASAGVDVQMGP